MNALEKLRYLIDNNIVNRYNLAKELNMSKTTLTNYYEGITQPSSLRLNIIDKHIEKYYREHLGSNEERNEKTIIVSPTAISTQKRRGAMIYDIDATCGFDGRDIEFTDEKIIGSIDAPEINPESKIIFATGDSMLPLIASGDRIVIRRIESWDYFNYGQVYLIITNEYRFIKRVRKHPDDEENLILLRSDNPEYDDIPLPKKEIIHLFIVENILSIKNIL